MKKQKNIDNLIDAFDFLWNEYRFVILKKQEDNYGYSLEAKNDTTGIKLEYEVRDQYIKVVIIKIINGEIEYNFYEALRDNNLKINGFGLDWILSFKNPEANYKPAYEYKVGRPFSDEVNGIRNYIFMVAGLLKEYASNMLLGDFTDFDELDVIVKKYFKEYEEMNK